MPLSDSTPQVILISDETNAINLAVSGAIPAGTPGILMSGITANNSASFLKTDISGNLFITKFDPPTFMVTAENIQIGNNKSMISLMNAVGSNIIVKIKNIIIVNVQTATIVGILAQFRLHKISAHSVGTVLTPISFDSNDSLDIAITVRTGATVTEGNFFKKTLLQTNEINGSGGTGTDTLISLLETQLPFFNEAENSKAIILRANEGIHIRQATNSTVGTFDFTIVFTTEASI